MRFEGRVSADKISTVKVGQRVSYHINGYGDRQFTGIVKRIDPSANEVTRQVEVLVGLTGEQPRVSGLYAEGRIDAESASVLMVPESALVKSGDKTYAWKINAGGKSLAVQIHQVSSNRISVKLTQATGAAELTAMVGTEINLKRAL